MTKIKTYLWQYRNGDLMHGPFDSLDQALDDAKNESRNAGRKTVWIWSCRPARKSDKKLFHNTECSDGTTVNCHIKGWTEGRIVPVNIEHKFIVGGIRHAILIPESKPPIGSTPKQYSDTEMLHRLRLVAAKAPLHKTVKIDEVDLRRLIAFADQVIWPQP